MKPKFHPPLSRQNAFLSFPVIFWAPKKSFSRIKSFGSFIPSCSFRYYCIDNISIDPNRTSSQLSNTDEEVFNPCYYRQWLVSVYRVAVNAMVEIKYEKINSIWTKNLPLNQP